MNLEEHKHSDHRPLGVGCGWRRAGHRLKGSGPGTRQDAGGISQRKKEMDGTEAGATGKCLIESVKKVIGYFFLAKGSGGRRRRKK